jgi:hypothetical protein
MEKTMLTRLIYCHPNSAKREREREILSSNAGSAKSEEQLIHLKKKHEC